MTKQRFNWLNLFLWLAVPLFLWLALRGISFTEVWEVVSALTLQQMFTLFGVNSVILLMIGARWWIILRALGQRLNFGKIAGYRLAGFGISYFTPGPQVGGEAAQVVFLHRSHTTPIPVALASVTLEKLLEVLANFAFLALGTAAAIRQGVILELAPAQAIAAAALILAVLLGYSIALIAGAAPVGRLLHLAARLYAPLEKLAVSASLAEGQICWFCRKQPRAVLAASLLSFAIWLGMLLEYELAANYLGIRLSLAQSIAALAAAQTSFLFPLPGGLGALETSQVLAMGAFGFSPAIGIGISLIFRARDFIFGGFGLVLSVIYGRSMRVALRAQPNVNAIQTEGG